MASPKNRREIWSEELESSFFVSLVRGSIILQALDRFTAYMYSLIKNGFFGYLFSGYQENATSAFAARIRRSKSANHVAEFRYGMCRRIESSVILYYISWVMKFLLGCKLKVYGALLASFGIYTAVVTGVGAILDGTVEGLLNHEYILAATVMLFASIPLILSKKSLSEGLLTSLVGRFVRWVTGFTEEDVVHTVGDGGHTSSAFLIGIICGVLTYSVSPFYILGGMLALIWLYLVLIRPELGVVTLFCAMPVFPTMLLAAVVLYTTLCWGIKLFRGKRTLQIEPVDIMAMAFLVLQCFGGVISVSDASLKQGLLMTCLAFSYFLVTQLMRSREWIARCASLSVLVAALISIYGIVLLFAGGGYSSDAWLDEEMFDFLPGRAVATLENPNMLGEYLILLIPIAVSMLIGRGEGLRRPTAFLCIAAMGACLICTFSRGAWLGLMIAAVIFLFIWHRRGLWLVIAGLASLPLLVALLPESIIGRFTSIGDLTDSSTSYRVHIWHASVEMIEDCFLTGIGIGEGAWDRFYPLYAYQGVEAAPHSHNLFLQIWLELGLFGILFFLAFLFLLYQSGFTFFSHLSERGRLKNPDISADILRMNLTEECTEKEKIRLGKTQLRISAAGPLCGILAALAQGMTDYAWYNYRVFLLFWLVCGLASAYIRSGRALLSDDTADTEADATRCVREIALPDDKSKTTERSEQHE